MAKFIDDEFNSIRTEAIKVFNECSLLAVKYKDANSFLSYVMNAVRFISSFYIIFWCYEPLCSACQINIVLIDVKVIIIKCYFCVFLLCTVHSQKVGEGDCGKTTIQDHGEILWQQQQQQQENVSVCVIFAIHKFNYFSII